MRVLGEMRGWGAREAPVFGGFRLQVPGRARFSYRLRGWGSWCRYQPPPVRMPVSFARAARRELAARHPELARALARVRREARRLDREEVERRREAVRRWAAAAMADVAESLAGAGGVGTVPVPDTDTGTATVTGTDTDTGTVTDTVTVTVTVTGTHTVAGLDFFSMGFLSKFREKAKRITLPLLLAGAATLGAGRARAAAPYDGALSGVAAVQGLEGADWHTDAYLYDAGAAPITVQLSWAPKGVTPDPDSYIPLTLQPHETVTLEDVVATTFATQGSGQIAWRVLDGDPSTLVVNANTYNRLSVREQYGQEVVGRRWVDVPNQTVPLVAPAPVDFRSYRANLAFTAGPETTQVRVIARNKSGNQLYNEVLTVAPGSWNQIVRAVEQLAPGQLPGVWFQVIGLDGPVDAAISLVNNATGDGANVVGRSVLDLEPNVYYTGAARVKGANNSNWQSNLEAINSVTFTNGASLFWLPRGVDNSGNPLYRILSIPSFGSQVYENVVYNVFDQPNGSAGTIRTSMDPDAPLLLYLQTLNVVGEDDQGRAVTYGQNVPGVNESQSAAGDRVQAVTGVKHNDDFRANLLLQNTRYDESIASYVESDATVTLWNPDGTIAATKTYHLLPGEYLQHDKFIDDILGADVEGGTLTVTSAPLGQYERGGVNAGVSVVNGNRNPGIGTNDGRYIAGVPVRIGNHPPVFEGMDYHADGTIDWGDADGDGYTDVGIGVYPDDPTLTGRAVFSDPDGDNVTCSWSPGVGYDALPQGFSADGCTWTFSPPRVPGQYWVAVTASDGRGGTTTIEQFYSVKNPPQ